MIGSNDRYDPAVDRMGPEHRLLAGPIDDHEVSACTGVGQGGTPARRESEPRTLDDRTHRVLPGDQDVVPSGPERSGEGQPPWRFYPDDSIACDRLCQHAIHRLVHRLNPMRPLCAAPHVIVWKMPR